MNLVSISQINYNSIPNNKNIRNFPRNNYSNVTFKNKLGFDIFTKLSIPTNTNKNEFTNNDVINVFCATERNDKTNTDTITNTKIYYLLKELGLKKVTRKLKKATKEKNFALIKLYNGDDAIFRYSKTEEFIKLSSFKTYHELCIRNTENGLTVENLKDQNLTLAVNKPIKQLNSREMEVLKNNLNYFKTFKAKTPEEESKNYLSLGKAIPKNKGIAYKKVKQKNGAIEKIPIKVTIEKESGNEFIFKDGEKVIGGAQLTLITKDDIPRLFSRQIMLKDYPEVGITGDRIVVNLIKNKDEEKYGGIGHLADLIEVGCCKKLGIEPNIISLSMNTALPIHYKRGKRFIPFELYDKNLAEKYNNADPNDIVKEIIDNAEETGEFENNIEDYFLMYMPKDLVEQYEKELKENPIF